MTLVVLLWCQAKGNCVGGKGSSQPKKRSSSGLRVRRTFQPHEYYQTFYHSTSALRMTADEAMGSTDTDDNEDELDWEVGGESAPRDHIFNWYL